MRVVKEEVGRAFGEIIAIIAVVVALLIIVGGIFYDGAMQSDFDHYFQIKVNEIREQDLVRPMIVQRVTELKKEAERASLAVKAIRNEPPALTLDAVKDKLNRFEVAKMMEEIDWSSWRRACQAARYENFVKECRTTE